MIATTIRRSLTVAIAMAALVMPALAQLATPTSTGTSMAMPEQLIFSGYVQGRYSSDLGDQGLNAVNAGELNGRIPDAFDVSRAYLSLRANLDQHISATVLTDVSQNPFGSFALLEAFGEYRFTPTLNARLGLAPIPFGYEIPSSASTLITLERSQVNTALLYPYTFDRGVFANYNPVNPKVSLSLGLVNGDTFNGFDETSVDQPDPNTRKNFVGRLGYTLPFGKVGISAYEGTDPFNNVMDRTGADLELTHCGFTLISEALAGRGLSFPAPSLNNVVVRGTDRNDGAYATLAYRMPNTAWQPYVRLETFDPDENVANVNYHRATAGISYYLKNNTKLTLEYQSIADEANPESHRFLGTQYQVCF